jgi:hypothetical protein
LLPNAFFYAARSTAVSMPVLGGQTAHRYVVIPEKLST